ncbi:protein immune deficiency isoform X1 [Microplitis mediator]|uniref:protein immune deficiency isoform X1 n=1 Tax=Microplitis mediator TaxID=375433 RepID=UPI0025545B14|nr:protein immune deficiency isoform X1 [Microplitis mediator]XP_057324023.1 protein immune deficiency isoform X1 [Microplitis mediator]
MANLDAYRKLNMLSTDAKPDPPRISLSYMNDDTKNATCKQQENFSHKVQSYPLLEEQNALKKPKNKSIGDVVNYNIINSNYVTIGTTNTYSCNIRQVSGTNHRRTKTSSNYVVSEMPQHVKVLSLSEQQLTIEHMFLIKTHIGYGWRRVFESLGYSKGQIDQFVENHRMKGIDEVIYQLLLDWKYLNGRNASIGTIINHLWKCQIYDCAEKLAATG